MVNEEGTNHASHENQAEEDGDLSQVSPESAKDGTTRKSEPSNQTGGIRETGIFSSPDPLDPSTKKAHEKELKEYTDEEFSGNCAQCGREMTDGRNEAKCLDCGVIMHQFCFDAHVIKSHRPDGIGIKVIVKEGKFFARTRNTSAED